MGENKVDILVMKCVKDQLLKKYPQDTVGIWRIEGEDPNCDLGGQHGNPYLKTVEGSYDDAVMYALTLPGFIGWGYGGNITKVEVVKL